MAVARTINIFVRTILNYNKNIKTIKTQIEIIFEQELQKL